MKLVKVIAMFAVLVMFVFVMGCQTSFAAEPEFTFRLGHVDAAGCNLDQGANKFAELVKEATGGAVVIQVAPNSLLGGERDLLEGLQLGTIEMAATTTAPMSNFVPEFNVFDAPFLYRDDQHAWNVADGEVGTYLNQQMLEKQGIRILGYEAIGYRELFSVTPVEKVEDLAGMKVRTMENELHMAAFSAMKAIPTPMAYSELYTALQQKTVDAAEGGMRVAIIDMKFHEVAPNVTMFGYVYCLKAIMISDEWWNRLPEEYRVIIAEKAKEAVAWQRQAAIQENIEAIETLRGLGCNVYQPDKQPFIDACQSVYIDYADRIPADLLEKARNTKS